MTPARYIRKYRKYCYLFNDYSLPGQTNLGNHDYKKKMSITNDNLPDLSWASIVGML
jgi:hypothetical protein